MSFGSPAWLLLLLLAGLVAFLHSRPRRNVEVSSLLLWRHITDAVPPRAARKLPAPNLLMLLQILVVAFIALALARPFTGARAEFDHWIVLLDASSGMHAPTDGETPFEEARAYLASALRGGTGSPARTSLVSVASRPAVVGARLSAEQLRGALDGVRPSHTPADWEAVGALLPRLMLEGERTRVTILSDADGIARARVLNGAQPDLPFERISFGRPAVNIALARVLPSLVDGERGWWRVSGEVHSTSPQSGVTASRTVPLRVLFEPAGSRGALEWSTTEVHLTDDGFARFDLDLALPGPGLLEIRLDADDLAHDNQAHFVLHGVPVEANVLYVGPGNAPLERALEAVIGVRVTRARADPGASAAYDLIIYDGVPATHRPNASVLWLGTAPDGRESTPVEAPVATAWLDTHPLSRSVDWSAVSIRSANRVPALFGAEVVLEAADLPLVQARTTRAGREIVVAFDLAATDWPQLLGFPAFIANLLSWAVPDIGSAVAEPCTTGVPCPLAPADLAGDWRVVGPGSTELPLPSFYLTGGSADPAEEWLPRGTEAVFTPQLSGVYTLESGGVRKQIAVNALHPFEPISTPTSTESQGFRTGDIAASSRMPVWGWLLLLALLVLVAEGLIAGRTTERFLRRDALSRENPLASRRRAILALRAAELTLLILAIIDFRGLYPLREAEAIVVMDEMEIGRGGLPNTARSFLAAAADGSEGGRRLGSVQVGSESRIASDIGVPRSEELGPARAPGADLEGALELAGALLPRETGGRIVLVSDGTQTRGAVAGALPHLLDRNLPIDVYLLPVPDGDDVAVEEVALARLVRHNEVAELHAVIASPRRTTTTVRLWREGVLHTEREVELLPGRNRIAFEVVEQEPGVYLYEVEADAAGDDFLDNNRNGLLVEVRSAPRLAIVTPQQSWGLTLADALALQGVDAEVMTPDRAPRSRTSEASALPSWDDFDVLALMNVPASDLAIEQMEGLEAWVRDAGGGLILMGGENTFGPGGYFDTPLEALSPLSARIPQEIPNLAIMFVLDRSGSMAESVGGGTRLDIAKVATLEAVELLDPESLVGVVAFDEAAYVVVPIQPAGDLESVRAHLERLEPGGGTWLFPGLGLGYTQLSQVDSTFRRHIVLMTDGQSRRSDVRSLLGAIVNSGMTVSTAAIGRGADAGLLAEIARGGGGAAHVTTDFAELPSILAREANRFSSGPVREEPLAPSWRSRDALFLESLPDSPPPLHGFVRTTAKPGAHVHLEGAGDVPLLASWRYGLGRVAAFASHGAGPWASEWMASPDYATWWAQIVRWAVPGAAGPGLHLQLVRDRDYGRVRVEAVGSTGTPQRGLSLQASISAPETQEALSITLAEAEAGIYQGTFLVDRPGTYAVAVSSPASGGADTVDRLEGRLFVGYPARYEFGRPDTDLLRALAQVSGGRVMTGSDRIFDDRVPITWVRRSSWPFWTLLALLLLMIELVGRYALFRSPAARVRAPSI